jgi:hypothetical protein
MNPICSQCGHVMKLVVIHNIREVGHYSGGAHFECTNCDQKAHVRPDGSGTMTLVDIHPQSKTPQQHHEYADYWAAEKMMFLGMRLAADYITQEQYDADAATIAKSVEEHKAEHPIPLTFWEKVRELAR